jgi:hypothetical protein
MLIMGFLGYNTVQFGTWLPLDLQCHNPQTTTNMDSRNISLPNLHFLTIFLWRKEAAQTQNWWGSAEGEILQTSCSVVPCLCEPSDVTWAAPHARRSCHTPDIRADSLYQTGSGMLWSAPGEWPWQRTPCCTSYTGTSHDSKISDNKPSTDIHEQTKEWKLDITHTECSEHMLNRCAGSFWECLTNIITVFD